MFMLCAGASAPFNVFVDVIFEDILSAPLSDEFKVNMRAQGKYGSRKFVAPAPGVVRQSIVLANTAVVPLFSRVLASPQDVRQRKRPWSKFMEVFVLPGAFMRQVPPSVVDTRTTLADILRGTFKDRASSSDDGPDSDPASCAVATGQQKVSKWKSKLAVVRMSMLLRAGVDADPSSADEEREKLVKGSECDPEAQAEQTSPFAFFVRGLGEQGSALSRAARAEFQQRWG